MTVERGIIIDGQIAPVPGGSSFVLRDSDAWWERGERGTFDRDGQRATVFMAHWTAGPCREGPDAGAITVKRMKARKRKDGTPMQVGIHFVISGDGLCWQTADLAIATMHVSRGVSRRSIGVEHTWPGSEKQARKLGFTDEAELGGQGTIFERREVRPKDFVRTMRPSQAMLEMSLKLANTLASIDHPLLKIPRRLADVGLKAGAAEHFQVPGTTKNDSARYFLDRYRLDGWADP